MTIGIYNITDTESGRSYIGSSKNIEVRWYRHRTSLRRGVHHSPHLQRVFDKRGEGNLTFTIVEVCPVETLLDREQYYLEAAVLFGLDLNGRKTASPAGNRMGQKNTPEHNARMSAAQKGKPRTHKKREWTDEQRAAVAAAVAERHATGLMNTGHNQYTKASALGLPAPLTRKGQKMPDGFGEAVRARMLGKKRGPYKNK